MALYYMPKYREKLPSISHEDLLSINELSSLAERMEKLSISLEIPATEFYERRSACAEVRELLRKYYPDCQLLMFGSSVNGFGVKNCDLDLLFLPFPGYCNLDHSSSDGVKCPEPASILTGEVSRDVLAKLNEFSHLKFIRTILRREKSHVKKVNFIPAKTPSLKVHLSNCKIVCDISASNRLVVFNSELLQFFEKLDIRVKPLVLSLRFWARSLGFIKRSFFSSYGFTLLIIFFLQNTSPPVLPTVQRLCEIAGFSRMTAGWQTAFTTDVHLIPESKNKQTTSELLIQFFDFCWNFDFVQNIISLYTGKAMPVREFKNAKDERMKEFEVMSFNIQDPFILSQNICRKGPKIVFKLALFTAYQMLHDKSEKFKFSMLFDPKEYQKVFDFHYSKYMIGAPKVCFINLEFNCFANLSKSRDERFEVVVQTVYDLLQYGLLMECEVTDKISPYCITAAECKKNDGDSKDITPFSIELLSSIQCILYFRTWVGRKNIAEIKMETDNELEEFSDANLKAEYNISKELVKQNPSANSNIPLLCFKCECYKHSSPQIADVVIMLKPLTLSREFYQVGAFLSSYIPKTVKKILAAE